jgi:NADH-quinone oxidoreductase subunit L
MTVPLVILAVGAVALGFLGTPAWPWLQSRLTGQAVPPRSLIEGGSLMAASIVILATGLGSGWALYGRRRRSAASDADPLALAAPRLFAFLGAGMRFDELYAATLGRLNRFGAALADALDRRVWGGAVALLARAGKLTGLVNTGMDQAGLNAGFDAVSERIRGAGRAYSRAQTGETHGYLRTLAVAFVVLALLVLFAGLR